MSRRPFRVTLTLWLVLFLTAWNGLRLWTAIAWREVLVEFSAKPSPSISSISGAVWFVIGCLILWKVIQGSAAAWNTLLWAAAGYSVWYWTERLLWQEPRPNWPFAVALNLVLMILVVSVKRSMTREAYERKDEDPDPQ